MVGLEGTTHLEVPDQGTTDQGTQEQEGIHLEALGRGGWGAQRVEEAARIKGRGRTRGENPRAPPATRPAPRANLRDIDNDKGTTTGTLS